MHAARLFGKPLANVLRIGQDMADGLQVELLQSCGLRASRACRCLGGGALCGGLRPGRRQIQARRTRQALDLVVTANRARLQPALLLRLEVGIGAEPAFEAVVIGTAEVQHFHDRSSAWG
jgi:hypothetical protein